MKRFEEIKNEFENTGKYMNTVGYNAINDLIQMVDLLIKRNSIENGNLKELKILFKNERILIIKTNGIIPVQKVKDKIKELDERIKNPERNSYWASYTVSECIGIRRILQDLLERSREDE